MPENNPENIPTQNPDLPAEEKDQQPKGNLLSDEDYRMLMDRVKKREEEINQPEQLVAQQQGETEAIESKFLPPRFKPTKNAENPSAEKAPFDVSGENVQNIIDGLKNKEEPAPELNQIERPNEPPKKLKEGLPITPEPSEGVFNLKNDLAGSLQELTTKWLGVKENEGKVAPELVASIDSSYSNMQRTFFKLTGESLDRKVRIEAKEEAEKEGGKIISRKEFFGEKNIAKNEEEERRRRIGVSIKDSWHRLPDQKMQKYVAETGSISAGQKKYARDLETKRQELQKKGIDFAVDVYYDLLSQGVEPQNAIKKGLFGKKIFIPRYATPEDKLKNPIFWSGNLKNFKDRTEGNNHDVMLSVKDNTRLQMEKVFIHGKQVWMDRKVRKIESITENIAKVEVNPEPINSRDNKAFEKIIESTKTENALELLSDEELDFERSKLKKSFSERMGKVKKIISEDCEPICKALGLTPEKSKDLIKAAKIEGSIPDLDEKSKSFLTNILENFKRIEGEYQSAAVPIDKLIAQRAKEKTVPAKIKNDKNIEKALAEIRGKIAAA